MRNHDNNFNLIRLAAALQVLLIHSFNHFAVDGWAIKALKVFPGVPIFFFISGYLIATTYRKNYTRGLKEFFKNRILRIYPALWICIFFSTLAVLATDYIKYQNVDLLNFSVWIVTQTTILQFYNPDFMRSFGTGVLNGSLWTISVELQFYLLVPFIFLILNNYIKTFVSIFTLSIAANLFLRAQTEYSSIGVKLLAVSFLPWVYMFLVGFYFAHSEKCRGAVDKLKLSHILIAYIVSMNFVGSYTANSQNSINPISFLLLSCLLYKAATFFLPLSENVKLNINRNDISYGVYLYHMPIINILLYLNLHSYFANILLVIMLSIFMAILSWYLVERPALMLKNAFKVNL